jgi:hypothetical protein
MSKLYGIHPISLRPGVKAADFEKFVKEELPAAVSYPGWEMRILKGERGEREDKYLVLIETESIEARNRFAPRPDEASEEVRKFWEDNPETSKILERFGELLRKSNKDVQ